MPREWRVWTTLFLATALFPIWSITSCPAQGAQGKVITIVVPFTPGSGADTIARALSEPLREELNQVVVVENRIGASGNIGTSAVARAAADGTTLLLTANTLVLNAGLFNNLDYDPINSFSPIMFVATGHMALATHFAFSPRTVGELIAMAKASPGKINYASPGRGTPHHLAMELLQASTNAKLTHIPYSGLARAMTDLSGGHVNVMFVGLHSILPLARASKVNILGVSSRHRVASAPDIPTITEQGVPDFEVEAWFGLLAPKGTPIETINRINVAMNNVIKKPKVAEVLATQGLEIVGGSPVQLRDLLESDLKKWLKVIKEAGISAD